MCDLAIRRSSPSEVFPLKDLAVLDEVRKVFHETTGLALSFHYPGETHYDFYPQNAQNTYCMLIQSTRDGLARCLKSDDEALAKARATGEYCIYTCHAGLMNAVVPLTFKGREIGAIFTGQIFTTPQTNADFVRIYENLRPLGLARDRVLRELARVKVFDEEKLLLGIKLGKLMANYIISVEDEMSLQSEVYRKEQEILRYENEQMRLKNDLQNLSILVLKDRADFRTDIPRNKQQKEQKRSVVTRAQEFMHRNYNRSLTLSDVAEAVYLSPNYFSTIFKEVTGHNFSSYLNIVRIREGEILLRETNLPVKQIVSRVGFDNYNYFNRVFKHITKFPPATYREMFGGKKTQARRSP